MPDQQQQARARPHRGTSWIESGGIGRDASRRSAAPASKCSPEELDAEKKPVLRRALEAVDIERRMIEQRQPVQRSTA